MPRPAFDAGVQPGLEVTMLVYNVVDVDVAGGVWVPVGLGKGGGPVVFAGSRTLKIPRSVDFIFDTKGRGKGLRINHMHNSITNQIIMRNDPSAINKRIVSLDRDGEICALQCA